MTTFRVVGNAQGTTSRSALVHETRENINLTDLRTCVLLPRLELALANSKATIKRNIPNH